ncbi:MAG: response regulator [Spirochaetaceae bacterium]|jgi:signal transduction histidine kinase/CheY-like chemotaxis protein|nr:response regulator [Spirochaetaceae bacterium]
MSHRYYWTVGRKITAGFLLLTLIMLIISIISLVSVKTLKNSLKDINDVYSHKALALEELNNLRLMTTVTIQEALLARNHNDCLERLLDIKQRRKDVFEKIDDLWVLITAAPFQTEKDRILFQTLKNEYKFWRVVQNSILDAEVDYLIEVVSNNSIDAIVLEKRFNAFQITHEKMDPMALVFAFCLDDLIKENAKVMGEIAQNNLKLGFKTESTVVCFIFFGVIIAIVLGAVVTNLITIPVRNALKLLTAMSKGEHIEEIKAQSNDEIGQMIILLKNEVASKLEAKDFSRSKIEFLAVMSHEMKTPLNAILGLAEVHLQKYSLNSGEINAETASALKKIKQAGKKLLNTANIALDISKIEMGKMEFNQCKYNTAELIESIIHPYKIIAANKNVAFEVKIGGEMPENLWGDKERIKQILKNLLSNAFKFTSCGSVKLEASAFNAGNGSFLTFVVSDTGIGLKESDILTLFSDFHQADGGINRKNEGLGLGLSISKRLAVLMGGDIKCESSFGKGSCFTFQIPQSLTEENEILIEPPYSTLAEEDAVKRSKTDKGRALIVDDIETNIYVAKEMVSLYNMEVDGVFSGKEAIEIIKNESPRYDVIFMDHMMPEMNGMEATGLIRSLNTEYAKNIPIIALTANTMMGGGAQPFIDAGMNAFLSKPLEIKKLDEEMIKLGHCRALIQTDGEADDVFNGLKIDGVNFSDGLRRFSTQDMYKNIIQSFIKNTPSLLKKIEHILEVAEDSAEFASDYSVLVHGIKGSVRSIGGYLVGDLAEELEKASKLGDKELLLKKTSVFIKQTENLIENLKTKLFLPEDIKKELKDKPDRVLLEQLAKACDDYNTLQIDAIMSDLEKYTYLQGEDFIAYIREQLDNYDFMAISEKIKALA